jgi:hypothetical protein
VSSSYVDSKTGETVICYDSHEQREMIAKVIATFPATFGLRGYPGEIFRLSLDASFFSDSTSKALYLYTQRQDGDKWSCFVKGTESELRRNIVKL